MLLCDNCICKNVCSRYVATGGHVRKCDNFKANRLTPCHMCDNARLNHELTDDNDYSSCTIGSYDKECRIMLSSGWGKPLRIEIERWNDKIGRWEDIGIYYPKYCPECGREIKEYKE